MEVVHEGEEDVDMGMDMPDLDESAEESSEKECP